MQLARSLALASIALSPLASAQTWTQDVEVHATDSEGALTVAASEGGRFAAVYPYRSTSTFKKHTAVTTFATDGSLLHQVALSSFDGGRAIFYDAEFLDEQTLVVCGEVEYRPYMAAIDLATGLPVWERSVKGSGKLENLTRNHLGQFIGMGEYSNSPYYDVVVMAVGSTGTFHWFRDYGVGPGHSFEGDVVTATNGDLFLVYTNDGEMVVVRTTEWGHTLWSARYGAEEGGPSTLMAAASPDGGLVLAGRWYEDGETWPFCIQLDADGDVEWSKRYEVANPTDYSTSVRCVDVRSDGNVLFGIQTTQPLPTPYSNAAVMSLDTTGAVDWVRQYAAQDSVSAPDLAALPDGGFIAGSNFGSGGLRMMRADVAGESGGCTDVGYVASTTSTLAIEKTDQSFTYENYPHGLDSERATPILSSSTQTFACVDDCRVLGGGYGAGTPGTFGIVPTLTATDGLCLTWGPELTIGAGTGGGLAYLALSFVPAQVPMLGGTVYVNPATAILAPPMVLDGAPGLAGVGAATVTLGGDLSGLAGSTVHVQAFLPDTGAAEWLAMTAAATLTVQ